MNKYGAMYDKLTFRIIVLIVGRSTFNNAIPHYRLSHHCTGRISTGIVRTDVVARRISRRLVESVDHVQLLFDSLSSSLITCARGAKVIRSAFALLKTGWSTLAPALFNLLVLLAIFSLLSFIRM